MKIATGKAGAYTLLKPKGRLSLEEQKQAQTAFEKAISDTNAGVIVDCTALEYVSSAGLRAFLISAQAAQRKGIPFTVCCLQESVASVFNISGFDRIIPVHEDLATAQKTLDAG